MNFFKIFILFLLIIFGLSEAKLYSQNVNPKPSRQSSLEAFTSGEYGKAYDEFNELLKTYSKDPLYKYYAAVCLVKLERNPAEAVALLQQALKTNTASRPLPSDALFYLARAQHLNGDFKEASGTYNKYSDQAGRKLSKEQGVSEFIQQCSDGKGASEKVYEKPAESVTDVVKPEVADPVVPITDVKKEEVMEDTLPEKELLPGKYSFILDEALAYQFMADSVNNLITIKKQQLDKMPNDEKAAARRKIADYEKLAASYQKSADEKYKAAHIAMNPEEYKEDKVVREPENKPAKLADNQADMSAEKINIPADTIEIFSYFKILDKPVNDPKEKIEIDPEVPEGLIYRIQVAVFRNPVSPVYFKGITPIYGFRNANSELKTYYAGLFRRMEDARNALGEIKSKGFKDSFISSFLGKKQVSADRAAVLEKEWELKPFERTVNQKPVVMPTDTLPPTLVFRVEVMRVLKPVKPDVIETITTLAGNRGLDILTLEDKKVVYLIGNFITFDSAAEYADLIVRNGYRDAKVVAWLGTKEMPVETAKQLFEYLK
ncbi:MAG TPA: tetratricopeptide repeat protein [Bacteroidales bacterium]|nr:tetratricopeptide repeat protein [Bacteroidales bacterium]